MGIGVNIDPRPRMVRMARVGLGLCVLVLATLLLGTATLRCTPRLPPVSGCAPLTTRCTASGRPEVCSSSRRWEPIGDSPCAAAGEVCVETPRAHCAPMQITASTDGGTDAR